MMLQSFYCCVPLADTAIPIDQCLVQPSSEKLLLQHMGTHTETHRQALAEWEPLEYSALNGCLHQLPPLRAQGTIQKRKDKECKSQREWRTPRNQGPLSQHAQSSYELAKTAAACIGAAQGPPCLCYGFQFSEFMGSLSVKMSGSLTLVPSLGLFSFCWLGLSNFCVLVFVLPCYILFYFLIK